MSLKQILVMISIALMMTVYIGTAKDEVVKDGGYDDTINDVIYIVNSGQGEND